jgi:carbonic anhydrase
VKKVEKVEVKPVEAHPSDFEAVLNELIDGNDRFSAGVERRRDVNAERAALAQGQHPRTIVLGCSDSRVPPELLFDESLGDLFVVRSAGNVADKIGLASIEYAAEHLHASVVVVLGHEKCGAVTAAASGEPMESVNLQALVDEIAPGLATLRPRYKGAELIHLGVEANVTATANELIERSPLIRKRVEEGRLTILRAVYDLDTGHVRWLNLDEAVAEKH